MTELSDDLLARIRQRAADPSRRYMTAAEDQARVELPVDEIERRFDEWHVNNAGRDRDAALRGGMSPEEYDRNVELNRAMDERSGGAPSPFHLIQQQMRAWGQATPATMSFVERSDGSIGASTEPPGAKPLAPPPTESDWDKLETIVGRPMPDELKGLYSIADGGFGPGFTGLNPLRSVGTRYEDFRRRGPDYCGTVDYPASFVPIAGEMLDYHYDLDTGRIVSSNQDWDNDPQEPKEIYDIAFQSLAEMMEDWLARS